jgi:hypothetical protein
MFFSQLMILFSFIKEMVLSSPSEHQHINNGVTTSLSQQPHSNLTETVIKTRQFGFSGSPPRNHAFCFLPVMSQKRLNGSSNHYNNHNESQIPTN